MINKTVLVGRITRDPELKKTTSGRSVVSFTLACNRRFGNQEQADFINCVAWNQQADFLSNFITKGALMGVEGRIQSRTYEDATGRTIYVQEVVCESVQALEPRGQRQRETNDSFSEPTFSQPNTSSFEDEQDLGPILDITSDDLPF